MAIFIFVDFAFFKLPLAKFWIFNFLGLATLLSLAFQFLNEVAD